jgi:hypothetical protein
MTAAFNISAPELIIRFERLLGDGLVRAKVSEVHC